MKHRDSKDKYKILFVCTANKTRSPTLASLLKHLAKEQGVNNLYIDSCGFKEEVINKFQNSGKLEDIMSGRKVRTILTERGINEINEHKVKKISEINLKEYDLILTADMKSYSFIINKPLTNEDVVHTAKAFSLGIDLKNYPTTNPELLTIKDPHSRETIEYLPGIPNKSWKSISLMADECEQVVYEIFKRLFEHFDVKHEEEIRYNITEDQLRELLTIKEIGNYKLYRVQKKDIADTYFDTIDSQLKKMGNSLKIRDRSDRVYCHYKRRKNKRGLKESFNEYFGPRMSKEETQKLIGGTFHHPAYELAKTDVSGKKLSPVSKVKIDRTILSFRKKYTIEVYIDRVNDSKDRNYLQLELKPRGTPIEEFRKIAKEIEDKYGLKPTGKRKYN